MQKFTIFEKPIVKAFPVCYTTHDTKAGPSLTSDGYRNRTDTGGGRPCFYMRDLYLGERTRTGEYHGTSKGTGPADISVDSSADHCRFFIGYYDFLGITGYGFIPLVIMNATILHIPTIIGSLSAGRKVGMIVGFMFGIFPLSVPCRHRVRCSCLPCSTTSLPTPLFVLYREFLSASLLMNCTVI